MKRRSAWRRTFPPLSHEQKVGVRRNVQRRWRSSHRRIFGFCCRVVAEDDVNDVARRNLGLDGQEETDELLMPVELHVAADCRTSKKVPRDKQDESPASIRMRIAGRRRDEARAKPERSCADTPVRAEKTACLPVAGPGEGSVFHFGGPMRWSERLFVN